jgi:hypothetical protein
MRTPRNRFDVQVVFPDIAFGIKNRADVDLTPEEVADELEEFCARIRNGGKVPAKRETTGAQVTTCDVRGSNQGG